MGWKTIVSFWDMITCCRALQISLIPICEVGYLTCMREFVCCPRNPGMNQPMSWEEIWSEGSFRCCGFGREINVILGNRRPSWVFTGACFPCCFSKIYIDDTSVTLNRKNVKKKNITIPKKHSNHQMFRHLNFKFSFYTYIYIHGLYVYVYLHIYLYICRPFLQNPPKKADQGHRNGRWSLRDLATRMTISGGISG